MGRTTSYNNIVSEDLWSKVSDQNKRLLKDFLDYKNSTDKADSTINQYYHMLQIFFVWNLQNNDNKYFVDLKKRDIIRFINYLMDTLKSSPNRIKTVKAAMSSMSNYIEVILDDEHPGFKNIVKVIETMSKTNIRPKTILTEEQVKLVLDTLVEQGKYQIACAFALAIASGSRKAELTRFKVNYFKDEYIICNCWYETPEPITCKGRGKLGYKSIRYTLVDQFKPYFELWVKNRQEKGIESEWLFVTYRDGKYEQATIHTFDSWALTISKILGIDFYLHSCRHYWTSALKAKNIPEDIILELQSWKSPEMIRTYNDNKAKDGFSKYFSKDGIKQIESDSIK